MNYRGQAQLEFLLALSLIGIPGGVGLCLWGTLELERTRCALKAFTEARRQLILKDTPVRVDLECGRIRESIRLLPLENLEPAAGAWRSEDA